MSLLLRRMSKVCLSKKAVSCFSTAITSRSKPYLLLGTEIKENFLNFNLYDPIENKEMVKNLNIEDQSHTLRNLLHKSLVIGSSRGYVALRNGEDSSVHLVDISNQAKPKIISLPPLYVDNSDIRNVSVSPPVNGDVIIAVKFYGSRLSLCRVGDSEWTQINVPYPSFQYSSLIYSERDGRFSLNNWNPYYTGPIDFTPKSGLVTPVSGYLTFPLSNIEEFEEDFPDFEDFTIFEEFNIKDTPYLDFLENILVFQELVESPSGETFIVCWFIGTFTEKGEIFDWPSDWDESQKLTRKTHKIAVFKQDEKQKIGTYTNDIGDLCIFLAVNEAFCVSASAYPGLKPNSVYFADHHLDFGVCDLSSQTIVYHSDESTTQSESQVVWIPPTPTLPS